MAAESRIPHITVVSLEDGPPKERRAAYEHPAVVRLTHWVAAIAMLVLIPSGWQIFRAFPSFGPKIPQENFVNIPKALALGGWLAGGIRWHFTFMWPFAIAGTVYLIYEILSGHWRTVLFRPRDMKGVWPMIQHYVFFKKEPIQIEPYNALQKLAYTTAVLLGGLSLVTGTVMYKPVQFGWLAALLGGFRLARGLHFFAMAGLVAFIPGHLLMVAIHGWANFYSMIVGWKKGPAYLTPADDE